MSGKTTHVLVIGCGTMGSLALWRLAARGVQAIGLEQFQPGHDRGSGHGESRIIRTAYFEGPNYVPLVQEAFSLWERLEQESGAHLLDRTGGLMIGRPDSALVQGVLRSVKTHQLAHEILDAADVSRRYPQFALRDDEIAVFEHDAGMLRPEPSIETAAARAIQLGAQLVTGVRVDRVEANEDEVTVRAGSDTFSARRAIVCAGAWTSKLLPQLARVVRVERKVVTWFAAQDPAEFAPGRFPIFIWERDGGQWYGLPSADGRTVKVVIHRGGQEADPDQLERAVAEAEVRPIEGWVADTLPGLRPDVIRTQVCMYSMTPDEHFIVGSPSGLGALTVLAGFSGHGFKFASVLGDVAADLALAGSTSRDLAAFDPDRFTR